MTTPLRRVAPEDLSDAHRSMVEQSMGLQGEADFLMAGANAPELLDWYFDSFYKKVFYEGRVDVRIKELLRLQLSKTHGCFY
jgi:hypothetical protein